MSVDKRIKNRQRRIKKLQADRSRRLRLMREKGVIDSTSEFAPEVIPIDIEKSTKTQLLIPPLYYEDIEFTCRDCGKSDVWYAHAQQFYFEVLQASPHGIPVRCYDCRIIERKRKNQARKNAGHLME